jgi:hypothetical protein
MLEESWKYLGAAIAARNSVKLETIKTKLTEMRVQLEKIMESPVLAVQKIDPVKPFLLPSLDFMLPNGDIGEEQVENMDKRFRASINKA